LIREDGNRQTVRWSSCVPEAVGHVLTDGSRARADDEHRGDDACERRADDEEEHEQLAALLGVGALEESADVVEGAGQVADATADVVDHRSGVVGCDRTRAEGPTAVEVGPGAQGDRDAAPHDREVDHDVAEIQEGLHHLLVHQRTDLAASVLDGLDLLGVHQEGLGESRADQGDDDQVAPGEAGGGHDATHPVHEVPHATVVLGLVPGLAHHPGVEPGDREVQDPEEDDHLVMYSVRVSGREVAIVK